MSLLLIETRVGSGVKVVSVGQAEVGLTCNLNVEMCGRNCKWIWRSGGK